MESYVNAAAFWNQYAAANNLTPEEMQAGLDKLAKGDLPKGANISKAFVEGYQDGVFMAAAVYLGLVVAVGKGVTGAVIGGGAIAGSLAGGYFGKYASDLLAPYVGSFSGVIGDIGSASVFEISNDTAKELLKNKDKKQ